MTQAALGFVSKSDEKKNLQEAFDHLKNFVERPVKNLLLVEDDEILRTSITELIGNGDVHTTVVGTAGEALTELHKQEYDCMILDLGLPDMPGVELLEQVRKAGGWQRLPIIIYTARELLKEEEGKLKKLAESILIKDVRSPERLLDEASLFLHRNVSKLPERQRQLLEQFHHGVLERKKYFWWTTTSGISSQ